MKRRTAIIGLGSLFTTLRGSARQDYLLVSQADLDAVRQKTARVDWAGAAMKQLMASAEAALAAPVDIPDRGGQWGHWYSCKKDGTPLIADSLTRHRCPKCGTIYTGEPYDSVYLTFIHGANSGRMRDMALAYRFTGRREFATKTAELLSGYGKKYLSYPRHDNNGKDTVTAGRIGSQTLDEATWLIPVTWAYALIRESLDDGQRSQIESGLLLPATETIIGPSFDRLPNIQCWKDSAIGCVGFTLGNDNLISTALDNPARGFRTLMSRNVMPGGLWSEGTLGYHQYALQALWPLAEAARMRGVDLYANENYRSMFDAPIALALPDGSLANFNDNSASSLRGWASVYELAFTRWRRDEYGRLLSLAPRSGLTALLYGAESIPTGDVIPKQSSLLRESGFAVLRSSQVSVAVRFGMHGSGHGHPDMLNIITYGAGRLFGLDPGSIAYGVPLHREWYRTTIAHNTVCVDQTQQSNADGAFIAWSSDDGETSLAAEAAVYPGVILRRELQLRGVTLKERFHCESEAEHLYDWAFHASGVLTTSIAMGRPQAEPLGPGFGYNHIEQVQQCQTDGDWTARWQNGSAALVIRVKGEAGTIVFTGVGPGQNPADRVPLLLIRRRTTSTLFDVTHSFGD